jgi:hypothetical protein
VNNGPRVLHVDAGREMRGGQWQALFLLEKQPGLLLARPRSQLTRVAQSRRVDVRPLSPAHLASYAMVSDLIHAHDAKAHAMAVALSWKPVLVARRVAFPVKNGLLSRIKYARARHYIAVSEYVRRTLIEAGIPERKVSVVYDGVPLVARESMRRPGRVIAIGSKDPNKCAALAENVARRAGVKLNLSFDLPHDLETAAVLLYLTTSEGLGSAALLALASGVPVIASNVGGLPEVVHHGDTGLLVENDVDHAAAALRELLDDPERGAAMGRRGRTMVEQRFSVDALAQRTAEVYERILG